MRFGMRVDCGVAQVAGHQVLSSFVTSFTESNCVTEALFVFGIYDSPNHIAD